MPRRPRIHFPGALFHVMSRGNARQPIFLKDKDWRVFLRMLAEAKARFLFRLYAYCLMPNHFHLLIESGVLPIAGAMHLLLTGYAVYFNREYQRVGHVFQGRYKPILCDRDPYLLALIRYIPLNPVRAGLVKNSVDWPWSSHREYLSLRPTGLVDTAFPLSLFHDDEATARSRYEEFVSSGQAMGHEPRFYPDKPYLGVLSESLVKKQGYEDARRPPRTVSLEKICREISGSTGVAADLLRSGIKNRTAVEARWGFIRRAIDEGFTPVEIAGFLSCGPTVVSKVLSAARKLGKLGNV